MRFDKSFVVVLFCDLIVVLHDIMFCPLCSYVHGFVLSVVACVFRFGCWNMCLFCCMLLLVFDLFVRSVSD